MKFADDAKLRAVANTSNDNTVINKLIWIKIEGKRGKDRKI